MRPPQTSFLSLVDGFRPGEVVYLPGAVGELGGLQAALRAAPERLDGVTLVSCLVPGMNGFDYAGLHPGARLRSFLLSPALRTSFEAGRTEITPLAYSGVAAHMAALEPDLAVLHLSPPVDGRCGFGVCADFGPIVAGRARRRVGVINAAMPRPADTPSIALADLDMIVQIDEPLLAASLAEAGGTLVAVAEHVAGLIPNGAAIQTGIGGAPEAVWAALAGHRDLRLRSGMVTDGFLRALEAGAMAPSGHVAGVAFGSSQLYARLDGSSLVRFADVRETHGCTALAGVPRLFAVNSALEVDLFGQANLEWRSGRLVSGVGGAPDFAAAARLSPGGRFILALPSTAAGGAISRIVPRLEAPSVSLPRHQADLVVTEHGVADLEGLSLDARAQALISVAAPEHRDALDGAWTAAQRAF